MDSFKVKYKEEAIDLVNNMERSLLLMENYPNDSALIEEVFRDMHTLKGNSSMFGFNVIADFTHNLESIYHLVRAGEAQLTKPILNLTLSSLDHLSSLIDNGSILDDKNKTIHETLSADVVKVVNGIVKNVEGDATRPADMDASLTIQKDNLKTYQIAFTPNDDIFLNGTNPLQVINQLHELGQCKVIAHLNNIPALQHLDIAVCHTSWDFHLSTMADLKSVKEIFYWLEDNCTLEIKEIVEKDIPPISSVKMDDLSIPSADIKTSKELISPHFDNKAVQVSRKHVISSVRVPSERLDNLMNLVSELMTLQAKLGTLTEQNPQSELLAVTENLEKISTRLRDNAFNMCLLPIGNLVTPFHRLVRDLATELNKEIEFITEGTDTELDKNIMEGLSDPLMHLLRNSIDHGIEDPDVRVRSGKSRHGTITFKAYCAGTNVFIEIKDDGKGIDPEKIRKKAIEKNIIEGNDILSEKEMLNLIFLPGFSTADQVSEISGRGVGMDVVKRKIADIRGQIKLSSIVNKGTVLTIRLPLTVSIIDGLLVKINNADFVIPLSTVDRCYELSSIGQLNRFSNLIVLGGEQIPFISLSEEFDGVDNFSPAQEIVIVFYEEKRVGLIVDRIVGKFQAVLKSLGRFFLHMHNISGATILGDGKIALVLDTNNVTEQFLNKKNIAICR